MKRLIIVHGYTGYPEKNWFPWLKAEAEKLGMAVTVPAMPHTDVPQLNEWLSRLQSVVSTPDMDTFLVGHSLGCPTILRYLENLHEGQKIGGVILIAGFAEPIHFTELDNFTAKPWDDNKIRQACKHIILINSDNDEHVPLAMAHRMGERLSAELIVLHGAGHINEKSGYKEAPVILEQLKQITNI